LKTSGFDDVKFNKAIIKFIIARMAKRQEARKARELIEGTEVTQSETTKPTKENE